MQLETPPIREHASPLNEEDMLTVRRAVVARVPVRRAVRTAMISAISMLAIGLLALPCLILWPSVPSLLITVGLLIVGVMEYRHCRRLAQGDPLAAKALGVNQLCFIGVIVLYCVLQMAAFSVEDAKSSALSPEVRSQLGGMPSMQKKIDGIIEKWAPLLTYGFYGLVILASVASQGGLALYYFTRRKRVEQFNNQTPAWIVRLFREVNS